MMWDRLHEETFAPLIGQTFEARLPDAMTVPLTLTAVTSLGRPQMPGGRRPFALLFLGPPTRQHLSQGAYPLENSALGAFDLFIVPLGPQQDRMQYEAVFN